MSTARLMLCVVILAAGVTSAAGQKAQPPVKAAAAGKRAPELFVGSGSSAWLPKSTVLPTASNLEARAQKLRSRLRNVDPFVLSTFPREEDARPTPNAPERPTERVTLNQALQTLRVTGINIATKEMLIGGRNVFEGDVMMLSFRDEVFLAEVLQVGPAQILFRDIKRQETGALSHSLLPHLEMEPMQNRASKDSLQGKVTAIEPLTPQPR